MANLTVNYQPGSQNIESVVTINAPIDKVFQAFITQDLFTQWWARGNQMQVKAFNAIDGGTWHVMEEDEQGQHEFYGTFHEIAPNQRIIQTFEYLGWERGHVALEKAEFKELSPDKTEIRFLSTYQNIKDAKAMVEAGMEKGFGQSVQALGKLLEEQ